MKKGLIIGGLVVVVGALACGVVSVAAGVGGWLMLAENPGPKEQSVVVSSAPPPEAQPLIEPDTEVDTDLDTDTDTDRDSDSDTEDAPASTTSSSSGSSTRRTTTSSSRSTGMTRPSPEPFSAPGEDLDPEEDLGDLDLERTDIEIIDEELTPRDRRRLRREERRGD